MSAAQTLVDAFGLPEDGLYRGMPEAHYHRRILGVVSKSAITEFARTPMHYKAWVDGLVKDEETDALAFGRAFHCALLEPEKFSRSYAVAPYFGDRRFKGPKAERAAWVAKHQGCAILEADDGAAIEGMVGAIRKHPLASRMIGEGEAELTAIWTDPETKLRCKARADFYSKKLRMILDAKSCEDASPEGFRRSAFKYRYHWQHAIYRGGFAALGEKVEHFVLLAVEKKPPFAIGVYELDDRGVLIAHDRVRALVDFMGHCVRSNVWPGYSTSIETLETPPWET